MRYANLLKILVCLLLTPLTSQAYFVSGSYTGNGSAQTITLNFQPSVVIIKDLAAAGVTASMQIRTSTMTVTKDLGTNSGTAGTDRITALTTTGFTVGAADSVNKSGLGFTYIAFDAVAGESVVGTYTGNGTADREITGVGFQPDMVLTTRNDGAHSIIRVAGMPANMSVTWSNAGNADRIRSLTADGFTLGAEVWANENGSTYHYIALKNVTGKFKAGSYLGTATAASITGLGFQPEGMFVRQYKAAAPVSVGVAKFAGQGAGDVRSLVINASPSVTDAILSLDSDGFSVGSTGTWSNGSGLTHYYMAWKRAAAGEATLPTLAATPTSASVTSNSATLGGNVTATGGASINARGVVYALTSANANPEIGGSGVTVVPETGTFSTGTFTRSATSLAASSGYSFKAYATNSAGTSYSSVGTFTTNAAVTAPTLAAMPTSASVTYNTATLGGNVTATGGADVTARGVVYALTSANNNPEIGGSSVTVVPETGTFSTGTFTRSATSLAASSGYSFKAYATNSAGTSYSSVGTFTTSAAPAPAVVIQPTSVLFHSNLRSSEYTAAASIDQVGLTATYTSGVTTLSSYVASNPRQGYTTALSESFTATSLVPALFDYDLGTFYDLENILLWNTKNDEPARVVTFQVFADNDPGFGSAVSLGTFTAFTNNAGSASFPTPVEVFNLTPATGRYVRFRVLSSGGASSAEFGEIAFAGRVASSIPPVAVASLSRNSAVYTQAGPAIWTLYFQSAVTGLTASNFDLTGAGATGATVGTPTTTNNGGSWTIPVSTGGEGTLTLRLANATNLSSPISTTLPFAGQSYIVDTLPPVMSIQSGPALLTNATTASFTFSATDGGSGVNYYEAKLDDGNYEVVTSPKSYTGLTEGEHKVTIKATDFATNEGGIEYTWTVDLTPPTVVSVTRQTPSTQNVNVTEVVFKVTYSEVVTLTTPEKDRYAVVPVNGSTITADVTSVSGTGATRDVTVTVTGGSGEFRLRVLN